MRPYFILSAHDDDAGVMGNMVMRFGWWQALLATAGMIAVINSVLAGAFVGLLLAALFNPAVAGASALLGAGALAGGLGWAATTAAFGAYHRLGGWSWRSIAGVTAAGGVFGLAYLLQSAPRSIWLPVVIHGVATAGFLSWGDAALHWWAGRRRRARPA